MSSLLCIDNAGYTPALTYLLSLVPAFLLEVRANAVFVDTIVVTIANAAVQQPTVMVSIFTRLVVCLCRQS